MESLGKEIDMKSGDFLESWMEASMCDLIQQTKTKNKNCT